MKAKRARVQVGRWYKTRLGSGPAVAVSTDPPTVAIRIVAPFERGVVFLSPGTVKEIPAPDYLKGG